MNFHRESRGGDQEEGINLTPLMDVMFLLVIFFAVSTTFRIYPGISVNLPKVQSESTLQDERTIVAVLTEKGKIFLDGNPVPRKNLLKTLKTRQASSPALMFVLQADEGARHGQVVELMDAAKKVGITRLGIATRKIEEVPVNRNMP